jgi:hypothetical protein
MIAGLLGTVRLCSLGAVCYGRWDVRRGSLVFCGSCQLDLNAVDAVDAVDEKNQDEYEGYLEPGLYFCHDGIFGDESGETGCQLRLTMTVAGGEFGRTYVNSLLRIVKGSGKIRSMKRAISATRSKKTWSQRSARLWRYGQK